MRNKRTSKRKLKARFMLGRSLALEDIVNRQLEPFVKRQGYEMAMPYFFRRKDRDETT